MKYLILRPNKLVMQLWVGSYPTTVLLRSRAFACRLSLLRSRADRLSRSCSSSTAAWRFPTSSCFTFAVRKSRSSTSSSFSSSLLSNPSQPRHCLFMLRRCFFSCSAVGTWLKVSYSCTPIDFGECSTQLLNACSESKYSIHIQKHKYSEHIQKPSFRCRFRNMSIRCRFRNTSIRCVFRNTNTRCMSRNTLVQCMFRTRTSTLSYHFTTVLITSRKETPARNK